MPWLSSAAEASVVLRKNGQQTDIMQKRKRGIGFETLQAPALFALEPGSTTKLCEKRLDHARCMTVQGWKGKKCGRRAANCRFRSKLHKLCLKIPPHPPLIRRLEGIHTVCCAQKWRGKKINRGAVRTGWVYRHTFFFGTEPIESIKTSA